MLTELMRNNTIDAIINEDGIVRKLEVKGVDVSLINRSLEKFDPLYGDSLIIVTKNETALADSGQYVVTRYWRDPFKKSIESEYMFDTMKGPYRDLFVLDDYAIVLTNTVNAIYYDQYRGKVVPKNLEQPIYSVNEEEESISKLAFWDSNGRGDYKPVLAVKTDRRMYVYSYIMGVDPVDRDGFLERETGTKSILDPSTVFNRFEVYDNFLIAACQTCNSGKGWVRVYNPDTAVSLLYVEGEQGHE